MSALCDPHASKVIEALEEAGALQAPAAEGELERLRAALTDMLSGWRYIRQHHGDLHGVGWDRCQQAAEAALHARLTREGGA